MLYYYIIIINIILYYKVIGAVIPSPTGEAEQGGFLDSLVSLPNLLGRFSASKRPSQNIKGRA